MNHEHSSSLTSFAKMHKTSFYLFDEKMTDQNYAQVSTKLVAGDRYSVKMFKIVGFFTVKDCFDLISANNAKLVGAQGLVMAYLQGRKHLQALGNTDIISLDTRENLPKVYNNFADVPRMKVMPPTLMVFDFVAFLDLTHLGEEYTLLLFCKEG